MMGTTLKSRMTQFWFHVQEGLFPFLNDLDGEMTPPLKQVATVLEMMKIERFVPEDRGVGRPALDRVALARALWPRPRSICRPRKS